LFCFTIRDENELILKKFNIWSKYYFKQYFKNEDAEFHKEIDLYNLQSYKNELTTFVDIAFRGAAKTARIKLFIAFAILNDLEHYRKYIKVLAYDINNAKQITTDIYNMFVSPQIKQLYPEVFEKSDAKREETMSSFTTATGVKMLSGTVGTDQRGALQDEARPDFIIFEDFENRKTLRSAVITKAIWDNMEEARTSLDVNGSCIYNCNYISEAGNVHKLVSSGENEKKKILIIPIIKNDIIAWPDRYTHNDIELMKQNDEDFEGERLCEPSAGADILFNREKLDLMVIRQPIKVLAGFKIFDEYEAGRRYGSGHDIAGGVGLDSSTSVFIDFDSEPARVVATFRSNTIKPEVFGEEVNSQQSLYGNCISAIENNYGTEAILKARQMGANLFFRRQKDTKIENQDIVEYGWNTNALTKPKMIRALIMAVENGLIELIDIDLIREAKSYSRNDLMDRTIDPRLTTRHFDLLMACAIAWQMKDYATAIEVKKELTPFEKLMNTYNSQDNFSQNFLL